MIHEREPCFYCSKRERELGQILCTVCRAWGGDLGTTGTRSRAPSRPDQETGDSFPFWKTWRWRSSVNSLRIRSFTIRSIASILLMPQRSAV
jgi:hypothetical protein